ncbi:putative MFS transporter [Durotheca rogersii]|uniref:putative MFS transporter n=1 Tax=Durotheca rogersii TaxID=419775 RepID=UPI00221F0ABA|nr:putative MFS transporter [Durotheca rogersii]KAI5864009.1 putative MFS transporter [Durotheca rogersii]
MASKPRAHLSHSHAHEENIPGTVNLQAAEGDDTGYGQALFPVPAEDPNDPLQWTNFKKTMILVICSVYSFLGNAAIIGPSPYIELWSREFGITPGVASELISYPNLAFGFGSLVFVPCYLKFGRRPVMLFSLLTFAVGLIASSQCTSYNGLLAARLVHCFGSSVCEALPVQLVNDIFYLHERGKRIGYYTVCLCLGTFAGLPAGYMLNAGLGWRLFFYVEFAFAMVLLIMAFFYVEETSYDRAAHMTPPTPSNASEKEGVQEFEKGDRETGYVVPSRKTFIETLSLKGRVDPDVPLFMTMIRSWTYFLAPQSLWVITTFGINGKRSQIGLSALAFSYTFPILIVSPPYNWPVTNSGLFSLASVVGYGLAIPFTSSSDRLAAYFTKRNNGIREAEMRLGVMLPAMLIGPAGVVLYGFTAERGLHWIGFFVGGAMNYWAAYFFFSFTLAYAVDSYYSNTSEMLIAMNIGKQAISFGFGVKVLDWVMESGYAVVMAGIFGGVLLANNLVLLVFIIWGKRIRKYMSETWLARLHFKSIREVTTH